MTKHTILCVDDEIDNVEALERLFRKKYTVLKATSAKEATDILDQHQGPVSLIISDQRMPEVTGVEFLESTLEKYPDTIRILLTGYTDIESVIDAVNKGQIFRYLTKPWDPVDLSNTVTQAVEKFELRSELQIKNKELAKALAELQSLDLAKSNFMILINHELKTPLTSIINFLSLLLETRLTDEQELFAHRIQKSADRLKTLVDDVLLVVKAETHQLKPVIVQGVIHQIETWLPAELKFNCEKKRQVVIDKLAHLPVECDLNLIRQTLVRLIHNAVKFGTEDSEILVASNETTEGIEFLVSNHGTKISAEVMDKIYRPFYINENVMNHTTGMGLGLTICQAILTAHHSKLMVENTEQGVQVRFILPRPSENY